MRQIEQMQAFSIIFLDFFSEFNIILWLGYILSICFIYIFYPIFIQANLKILIPFDTDYHFCVVGISATLSISLQNKKDPGPEGHRSTFNGFSRTWTEDRPVMSRML